MDTHTNTELRELDQRAGDGIEVRLLWRPHDDRALVAVSDSKSGESFTIEVRDDQRALDVFHHPFAYAGERRATSDESSGEFARVIT
jgi:hypothetical protein